MNQRQTGRKGTIRGLIGVAFFLKIACLSFCVPVLRRLFSICLRAAGYSYLTKENMSTFLLSPCVLCSMFLLVAAWTGLALFELNVVNLAVEEGYYGRKRGFSDMLLEGARRFAGLFYGKRRHLVSCLLFVMVSKMPSALFVVVELTQAKSKTMEIEAAIVCCMACFAAIAVWGIVYGVKKVLPRFLKRGMLLFLLEGTFYFVGVTVLVGVVLQIAPSSLTDVLLLRAFERYHFLFYVVFMSLNTVLYEYFFLGLYLQTYRETVPFLKQSEERAAGKQKKRRVRNKKILLWGMVVVVSVTALVETLSFFRNKSVRISETIGKFCITAHRGASENAPENTMAAIKQAVVEAADYAEIDVRLTADGVPVLLHDGALFRTTRELRNLADVSYEELSAFDAGSSYSAEFVGEAVPRLEDVLEQFGGKIGFNIELKTEEETLAKQVVALITAYGMEESCIISSVYYCQLERVKTYNEEIKTGYILSMVYGDFYEKKAADFFSIRSSYVTEHVVKQAHAQGKEVHAWTVNRENELKRMKAIGVDNIITDTPAYARKVLLEEKKSETLGEWMRLLTLKR